MKYKKKDKNYVLEDLNFSIKKGSFHAFIGENGAGKSTTIKIIAGLNNDYDGNVIINGLNVKENIEARKSFSYVPDKIVFPGGINTWEYIYNTALLVRNDKEGLKVELNNLLKKFEIEEIVNRNPNKLSSGQIKKVLLILAVLEKSKFIILDEPASFLDPTSRFFLFSELERMNKEGITIMISSHILEEIKKYVDSVTFIKKGKIIWSGKVKGQELIKKYNEHILGDR
ncbi:ABC transporter ATP-binding protein [Mesomycoplasma moatsii]|uniref:ABC transporter ATP-binding protein n=1 Tax=Mesomycoplasma moatsii TaxID=171287 RepID=UPI0004220FF0